MIKDKIESRENIFNQFRLDIEKLLSSKYQNLAVVMVVSIINDDQCIIFGNMCPVCAASDLNDYVEDNNIEHPYCNKNDNVERVN